MDYPGEKLLIKLWETLAEKGVGSLLQPWHEKRLAKAKIEIRKEELISIAQAECEVDAIKTGKTIYETDATNIPLITHSVDDKNHKEISDTPNFALKALEIEMSELIRKEVNIAKSIMQAEDILSNDQQEPSKEKIEDDWIYSWRENAGRTSASELQGLWGSILAGEIKQPGSYSIRTMEFLKTLSKSDAELIAKIAKFVIADRIYRKKETYLEKEGIYFSQLLFLQDIGILSGVESIGISASYKSIEKDKYIRPLVANNKVIILKDKDQTKVIEAEVYLLTSIGIEVLKLASFEVDNEYILSVAQDYAKKGIDVYLGDWVQETPEYGNVSNSIKVEA